MKHSYRLKTFSVIMSLVMLLMAIPVEVFALNEAEPTLETAPEEEVLVQDTSDESEEIAEPVEEADPYVLGEVEELRESNSKHFRMSDGSYTAVSYASDVHYEDDGAWKEIDNTLLPREDGIVNTASDVQYTFSADSNALPGITAVLGDYHISFSGVQEEKQSAVSDDQQTVLDGIADAAAEETAEIEDESGDAVQNIVSTETSIETVQKTVEPVLPEFELEIVNPNTEVAAIAEDLQESDEEYPTVEQASAVDTIASTIKYNEVNGGDSYVYELQGRDLKESVVVSTPREDYTYRFVLNLDGLTAVLTENGDISLRDADTEIFVMPAPYMLDADGAYSDAAAYMLSELPEGGYALTLTADAEWINASERAFPVVIDPSIFVTNNSKDGTDITTEYMTGGTIEFPDGWFAVGRAYEIDFYSYVKVNTLPNIPYNARFCKAWLGLPYSGYQNKDTGYMKTFKDFHLYAQEALDSWKSQFSGTENNNQIVDYMTIKDTPREGTVQLEVTQQAKKWYDDASSNKGIVLYAKQPNGEALNKDCEALIMFPKYYEDKSSGRIAMPFFAVSYRNIQGIESYYSNQSFGAGRAGTAYVSDYTGALTLVHADISDGYTLSHVYNSNYGDHVFSNTAIFNTVDYSNMVIGKGWKLSAQESVVTQTITSYDGVPGEYAIYTDADGTEHYFHTSAAEEFKDEDGLGLTLKRNITAHTFTMTDDKGNEKLFVYGYLTQIKDTNGNITAFVYNNAAYPANGTAWHPTASGNRLTKIVQKNDKKEAYTVATLGYTGNRLTSVTDRYGKVTTYAVSGDSNLLITITEPDNTTLTYGYGGGNYKMSSAYDAESCIGLRFTYRENKPDMMGVTAYGKSDAGEEVVNRRYYFNMTTDGHTKVRDCGKDNEPYTEAGDDIIGYYSFDNYGRTVSYAATNQSGTILSASGGTYQPHELGNETSKKNNRLLSEGSTGVAGQNKLQNGDGESDDNWSKQSTNYSSTGRSTEAKKSGKSSIKVNLVKANETAVASQTVNITTGGYYNVTAYVRSSDLTITSATGSGAYLDVTGSGVEVVRCDRLTGPTDVNINDGWKILTTIVEIPAEGNYTCQLKLDHCTGTVYFDEIRLTDGRDVSAFNLIENGNFDHGLAGASNTTGASIDDSVQGYNGIWGNALFVRGEPQLESLYSKDLPISMTAAQAQNTTFLLSGWAYARSLPMSQDDRTFQLTAEIHYDGGENQYVTAQFNPDVVEEWQYVCTPVVPNKNKAINGITVHCSFKRNSGFAYFDDLALLVEPCATYQYNDDGKLTAVNSTNRDELQYQYSGADLISSSGGASGNYTYEYDNAHNIIKASNEGLSQSMTYDDAGLVTSTTLKGDGENAYLKTSATYTADGTKTSTVTDALGNTSSYQYSEDGDRTAVSTPVSNTAEVTVPSPHSGHFTSYPSSTTYYQDGWDIYTNWDDSYFYVRFEADQLKSDQTRYLDWYFDNNGIHYRIYACWNEQTGTTGGLWFGRDDYGQTSYNAGAVLCRIDTTEGYAEFKVNRTAGEGIDAGDRLFLNRAYVWSGSWQMLDYASINRTVQVSSYATAAGNGSTGKVTTHTVTDDAGRTTQTYVNGIASVNYDYSDGKLNSISRGGYIYNDASSVQGAFTTYGPDSLVYAANGWKVYVQGGQDAYTYVRFENPNLLANETRYLDWYFDNGGVEYRMYARWEKETQSTYELWFGRDKTGEAFDCKSTEYAVDVKNGYAEFRLDPSIGGIRQTPDKVHTYGGFTLNRAYVWSGSWQMLDSQVFDNYVTFEYNNNDAEGKQTQEYSFAYDLFGNCLKTRVGNRTLITNTYDQYTTLTSSEYGNDYTVNYTYDELERITSKTDLLWTEQYAYDRSGNISWMQATSNIDNKVVRTVTYEYDTLGRLIHSVETGEDGQTLRYIKNAYNSKNQLTSYTLYNGIYTQTQHYTYNADGSLDTFRVTNGDLITNTYDSLKRVSQKTIDHDNNADNRITVSTAYVDGKNTDQTTTLVESVRYKYENADQTAGGTVYDYRYLYEYDNVGNITRAYYRTAGTDGQYTVHDVGRYAYDKQNQLVMEQVYDGNYTLIYNYDTYGNIRSVEMYQGVGYTSTEAVQTYATRLSVDSYGYTDSTWKDLLTLYNGYSLEYDEIGNPTQYYNGKNYSMGWYGRRLLSVSMGGTYCSYGYDSDGQRISKTVGNDEYTYLYYGTKLMQYGKTDCYDLYFFYDDNDQPLGFYYKDVFTSGRGRKFYFVLNAQGDVVQLRDSQNRAVANYHYDAWGKLLSITDPDGTVLTASSDDYYPTNAQIAFINPIRYRGYVYDNETGFYYLNTRYYDPSLRRFISADSVISGVGESIQGYNLFAYCANNPVNMDDSNGNWPKWVEKAWKSGVSFIKKATNVGVTAVKTVAQVRKIVQQLPTRTVKVVHYNVRQSLNSNLPETKDIAESSSDVITDIAAQCHQFSAPEGTENKKYCWPDGREAIYNETTGQLITDSRDIGTFNFFVPTDLRTTALHATFDVVPWIIWGNSEDDSTSVIDRILSLF